MLQLFITHFVSYYLFISLDFFFCLLKLGSEQAEQHAFIFSVIAISAAHVVIL